MHLLFSLFLMDACTTDLCKIQFSLLLNGLPLRWKLLEEAICTHLQSRDFHLLVECWLPRVMKENVSSEKRSKKKKSNSANIYIFETGLQAIHLCSQTSLQTVATLFTCNFGVLCNNTLVLDSWTLPWSYVDIFPIDKTLLNVKCRNILKLFKRKKKIE